MAKAWVRPDDSIKVTIREVTVQRGEFITVWLNREESNRRDCVQVELCVSADGIPEIFTSDGLQTQTFEEWEAAQRAKDHEG